jgi:hypothetical protein
LKQLSRFVAYGQVKIIMGISFFFFSAINR